MSDAKFFFGDAEYRFALNLGLIDELEDVCDAGVPILLRSVAASAHRVSHLKHIMRLALIGGGDVDPERAAKLVETYLLPTGIERCRLIALIVLGELIGESDDIEDEG